MSINENKEFVAINQKASERKAKAKTKAAVYMGVTLGVLLLALTGITALELIGWINNTFSIVLQCVAGCVAMFKCGYFWHEIKN